MSVRCAGTKQIIECEYNSLLVWASATFIFFTKIRIYIFGSKIVSVWKTANQNWNINKDENKDNNLISIAEDRIRKVLFETKTLLEYRKVIWVSSAQLSIGEVMSFAEGVKVTTNVIMRHPAVSISLHLKIICK